jgi:hypothetical protein
MWMHKANHQDYLTTDWLKGLDIQWSIYVRWCEENLEHRFSPNYVTVGKKIHVKDPKGKSIVNAYVDIGVLQKIDTVQRVFRVILAILTPGIVLIFGHSFFNFMYEVALIVLRILYEALALVLQFVGDYWYLFVGAAALAVAGYAMSREETRTYVIERVQEFGEELAPKRRKI